jgi:hypothetical protein
MRAGRESPRCVRLIDDFSSTQVLKYPNSSPAVGLPVQKQQTAIFTKRFIVTKKIPKPRPYHK